jgi:hypothetical protein
LTGALHKQGERDNQERQDLIEEEPVVQGRHTRLLGLVEGCERATLERQKPVGEIGAAGRQSHDRHDDVGHHAVDDFLEGATDNDTDREVHHAALHGEFFELRHHRHANSFEG